MARHTHTGRFGDLILADQVIAIDSDTAGALIELRRRYRENPISSLPSPALSDPEPKQERPKQPSSSPGITIDRYNHDNDLIALLESYGARRAKGSRRLMHCCGHPDAPCIAATVEGSRRQALLQVPERAPQLPTRRPDARRLRGLLRDGGIDTSRSAPPPEWSLKLSRPVAAR